jgi:hypothetical protein
MQITYKTLHAKSVLRISSTKDESHVTLCLRERLFDGSSPVAGLAASQFAPERKFFQVRAGFKARTKWILCNIMDWIGRTPKTTVRVPEYLCGFNDDTSPSRGLHIAVTLYNRTSH